MSRRVSLTALGEQATGLVDNAEPVEGPEPSPVLQQVAAAPAAPAAQEAGERPALRPAAVPHLSEAANGHRRPAAKTKAAPGPGWVRFDQYERKEARLREDQYSQLTSESRRLNRQRRGKGERITENTLIRVAIDLLLAKRSELEGVDEAELRRSLGL
jgi:hypothetical protein